MNCNAFFHLQSKLVIIRRSDLRLLTVNQIGKLNVYINADASELENLHLADRLMVQLIKIKRLGPRIGGMLYKVTFEETWGLLDEVFLSSDFKRGLT